MIVSSIYSQRITAILLALVTLVIPKQAFAHVKWFANPEVSSVGTSFSWLEVGIGFTAILTLILIAILLDYYCRLRGGILDSRLLNDPIFVRLFHFLIVIYLGGCLLTGNVLVPHVHINSAFIGIGLAVQLVICILLFFQFKLKLAAMLLIILFFSVGLIEPIFILEYIFLVGIAWNFIYGNKVPTITSLTVLRLTLGASLIVLSFTEKLLEPDLAINVLTKYSLNFMSFPYLTIDDRLFVLCAGMVEMLIGLLFVLGLMVRTTAMVIVGLMVASNMYFFWTDQIPLAMMELIGHLPVIAAALLLILYYGQPGSLRNRVNFNGANQRLFFRSNNI